jgi:hypothetical protein
VKDEESLALMILQRQPLQQRQMKEEEQQEEGEEYVANTGTLDRYFTIRTKIAES